MLSALSALLILTIYTIQLLGDNLFIDPYPSQPKVNWRFRSVTKWWMVPTLWTLEIGTNDDKPWTGMGFL